MQHMQHTTHAPCNVCNRQRMRHAAHSTQHTAQNQIATHATRGTQCMRDMFCESPTCDTHARRATRNLHATRAAQYATRHATQMWRVQRNAQSARGAHVTRAACGTHATRCRGAHSSVALHIMVASVCRNMQACNACIMQHATCSMQHMQHAAYAARSPVAIKCNSWDACGMHCRGGAAG